MFDARIKVYEFESVMFLVRRICFGQQTLVFIEEMPISSFICLYIVDNRACFSRTEKNINQVHVLIKTCL